MALGLCVGFNISFCRQANSPKRVRKFWGALKKTNPSFLIYFRLEVILCMDYLEQAAIADLCIVRSAFYAGSQKGVH